MTWVAVMVVLSTVPSTRTGSPVVTAPAEAALVPSSYVVVDASLMVTFSPAEGVSVEPAGDTLVSVAVRGVGPGPAASEAAGSGGLGSGGAGAAGLAAAGCGDGRAAAGGGGND